MNVGADNFRFTLENQNGRKRPCRTYRKAKTTNLHINSLDRYLPRQLQTLVSTGPGVLGFLNYPNSQIVAQTAGPIMLSGSQNSVQNCRIQTSRPLTNGYYSRAAITDMTLNLQHYNILGSYNNSFFIEVYSLNPGPPPPANVNGTAYLVTIPAGCYNYAAMANAILLALNNLGIGAWAVLPPLFYGTDQTGFVINAPAPVAGIPTYFRLISQPSPGTYGGVVDTALLQANGRFLRFLGFNNSVSFGYGANVTTQPTTNGGYNSTVIGGIPNFCYTDYIDVYSQNLTNYKDAKDTNTALSSLNANVARIYMTEAPMVGNGFSVSPNTGVTPIPPDRSIVGFAPTIITKKWRYPNWSKWSPNATLDALDITLRSQDGNILNWSAEKQTEWSGTITFTE